MRGKNIKFNIKGYPSMYMHSIGHTPQNLSSDLSYMLKSFSRLFQCILAKTGDNAQVIHMNKNNLDMKKHAYVSEMPDAVSKKQINDHKGIIFISSFLACYAYLG